MHVRRSAYSLATVLLITCLLCVCSLVLISLALTAFPAPLAQDHVPDATQMVSSRGESRVMVYEATAYTHTGYRTKTGTWPQVGRTIAVDPSIIPLGSRVTVNGREYVAEDTGRVIIGRKVDLFLETEAECVEFGRQMVVVQVENREEGET